MARLQKLRNYVNARLTGICPVGWKTNFRPYKIQGVQLQKHMSRGLTPRIIEWWERVSKLERTPESFQLEETGPRMFVNVASRNEIAVIDRTTRKIVKWPLAGVGTNFPMALGEKHRRLFVSARRPATLVVLYMDTGREVARLAGAAGSDDMWYDATRSRIYVPGGEGLIFVYQQVDADHYYLLAKVPSTIGSWTSAYFGQVGKHNSLYLAVPGRANRGAELWIYETRD